jgi:hypothetical protein
MGIARKIEGQIEASKWVHMMLSDWQKPRCPDVNSHSGCKAAMFIGGENYEYYYYEYYEYYY